MTEDAKEIRFTKTLPATGLGLMLSASAACATGPAAAPPTQTADAATRINLQNTPDPDTILRTPVEFQSGANTLKGLLFTPKGAKELLPGVVVTGAWTTVKEQMAGTYARELAKRGMAALVFDFTGWGASEGSPRYVEDPKQKTADIEAAVNFLATRAEVNKSDLSGFGICASSGYMAAAAAKAPQIKRLALVAPWLHDPKMAEQIYGGAEAVKKLIASGEAAKSGAHSTIAAESTTDQTALMYNAPYYTEADRGLIPAYDDKFDLRSWGPWLSYDAQASADHLNKATLIISSNAAAIPQGARAYAARTKAPVTERWFDGINQFDFYDRADVVKAASDIVAAFFEGRPLPAETPGK